MSGQRRYWLGRSDGLYATQKKPWQFDKMSMTLPRRGTNTKNKQFFIPQSECTEQYRLKNIPVEEQIDNDTLDELVANVDFNEDAQIDNLNKQLKKARIQKTLTDTKLLNQKLDQRKKLLFAQWSEKFFQQFSNHFGKLRNCIVQMHLNEAQVNKFNQTLDNCLNNLQLNLDNIWNQFNQEKQNEAEEV